MAFSAYSHDFNHRSASKSQLYRLRKMWLRRNVIVQISFLALFLSSGHVTADFVASAPSLDSYSITLQGNGSVSATEIVLSLGAQATSSIVYWNYPQDVQHGFKAAALYTSTECDAVPYYGGGDGFAFFFSPEFNPSEPISTGGTLGLANKTNIAMIGFDLLTGKVLYKATKEDNLGPRSGIPAVSANTLPGWRCSTPEIYVQIEYTPPTFRITSNATNLDVSVDMDLRDYFDPYAQLYVGLSAATGEAYMKQSITYWEYTGVPQPNEVVPIVECVEYSANQSQYIAHMGYRNPTLGTISYEIGASNGFTPDPQDRGQPTTFTNGRSPYYPLSAFTFQWDGAAITWNLSSNFVSFNGANPALRCPQSLTIVITFGTSQDLTQAQTNAVLQSLANFLGISSTRVTFVTVSYLPVTKRSAMAYQQGELELEIGAASPDTPNEPSAAESVQKFVESSSNSTLINEVLNPPGADTNINYWSVSTKPTGVEGTGLLVATPPVTPPSASPVASPIPSTVPTTTPTSVPKAVSSTTAISISTVALGLVSFAVLLV